MLDTQSTQIVANAENQLHPFIDGIMEAQPPPKWKMLTIDHYEELLDQDEHVGAFIRQMNLFTNDDTLMCWVFPTILKGPVLHWYSCLLRNSIDSFATLIMYFRAHYKMNRPHHLIIVALANIQREEDDSLFNFMKRFPLVLVQT